jgi:hypothetical protein
VFLVDLTRSRQNQINDLLERSYVDHLTAPPIADEKGSKFWTPRTPRSLEAELDAPGGFSSKPGGGSHRHPVVTHCSNPSRIAWRMPHRGQRFSADSITSFAFRRTFGQIGCSRRVFGSRAMPTTHAFLHAYG